MSRLFYWHEKKGTNSEHSDYQRKICQPSLGNSLNKSLNPELFLVVILETKTEKSISVMDTNYTHSQLHTFLPFPSTWGNNLQCGCFLKQRPDFTSQEVNVKHTRGSVRFHQLRPNNFPSIGMLNSPRRRLFFSPLVWTIDLLECLYLTSNAVNFSSSYSLN